MINTVLRFRDPLIEEIPEAVAGFKSISQIYHINADGISKLLVDIDDEMEYLSRKREQIFNRYGHLLTESEAQE